MPIIVRIQMVPNVVPEVKKDGCRVVQQNSLGPNVQLELICPPASLHTTEWRKTRRFWTGEYSTFDLELCRRSADCGLLS